MSIIKLFTFTNSLNFLVLNNSLVAATSTSKTTISADVKEKFEESKLVPDVIPQAPKKYLMVNYSGNVVDLGNRLEKDRVSTQPVINYEEELDHSLYSLIMADPDAPNREEHTYRSYLHWRIINIETSNITSGQMIENYFPPGPPANSDCMYNEQMHMHTDKFEENQINKDLLINSPPKLITIEYANGVKVNGNVLTPTQVKDAPIKVEFSADSGSLYTICMIDPDAPTRIDPKMREILRWMVINCPGGNILKGQILSEYIGSGPPKDTGLHRYEFLAFKQTEQLSTDIMQFISKRSREGRLKFKINEFAKMHNLGNPVAGNFYMAEYDDFVPTLHQQLSGN